MAHLEGFKAAEAWATDVSDSYFLQFQYGIDRAVLPEDLLWQTPGHGCFDELRKHGLKVTAVLPGKEIYIDPITMLEPESIT